jgi:hypothetical protein
MVVPFRIIKPKNHVMTKYYIPAVATNLRSTTLEVRPKHEKKYKKMLK